MEIVRRLGSSPKERCLSEATCPDVFELADGDFAVIGRDMTEQLRGLLPDDAGCGADERIVVVSRETLVHAGRDLPVG